MGDEVVAMVLDEDPPAVEVQCHGGPAALALVIEALEAAGAKAVASSCWAEYRAGSPLRTAALIDLASAQTVRAASILLDQAQGALDRELAALAVAIEAAPVADSLDRLEALIARGAVGTRLTTGWRVVLRGRPNVGKSRLLNALAGYERAIVDPTPGTTRDVVTASAAFDGWPVEMADTAGVRDTDDALERSGIERARRQAGSADLVLLVLDRSEPLRDEDQAVLAVPASTLLVANKSDLPPAWSPDEAVLGGRPVLFVSAERGDGLDELISAVVARLVPQPPPATAGVPFRVEQVAILEAVAEAVRRGDCGSALRALSRLGPLATDGS